ncbi:hypothetical protein C1H46_039932 [Malus baccata]|uniref:Uncharacterized protein n=1 Tax=Malus baccata TaxID=106549 RepID=A0A540KK15_MALBA|nr:hypothetical protein C1H46_039932 [Malus baccata]
MEAIAVAAFTFISRVAVVFTQVSHTRISQLTGTKFAKHVVSQVRGAVVTQIAPLIGTISATVNGVLHGAGQGGQGEPLPPDSSTNTENAAKLQN